jgi:hypothetical protein
MPGQYGRSRNPEGRSTSGSRGGQDWRDDDDNGRENFGRGPQAPRDDRGRFMSEGENRDYYGGERQYGRYEDNGGGDFGGRGLGERDYEERGYEGSRGGRGDHGYEQDDHFRGGSRGQQRGMFGRRDSEDRSGRERDEYGRFTGDDNYGGPRGGRGSGYEDDDRGSRGRGSGQGRGWFGDSRGHAEAARERWSDDDRGGRGGGSMRGGNRERDESGRFASDDDDRGMRGGRGGSQDRGGGEDHRGWFGDPRGHAEAARLGWRHRR